MKFLNSAEIFPAIPIEISTSTALALTYAQRSLKCTNATAITLTIPLNTSANFPIGTDISISQYGAGSVTFAAASGVTLNSSGGKKCINGQFKMVALQKVDTDEWLLVGDLI